MQGCDISEFQGIVNFDQLKTKSQFVIIRAGYSGSGLDKQFKRNQSEARRVSMLRGYYWFAYPERTGASADADKFLATVGALQAGEILVLDYEVAAGGTPWCKTFLDRIKTKTGLKAYLYTNQNRTLTLDWSAIKAAGYPLWVAIFDNNPTAPVKTGGWPYPIKQYTADGRMPGIGGAVDLDHFNGDKTKYLSYGYKGDITMVTKTGVNRLYRHYLGKDASATALKRYVGKMTDDQVAKEITSSTYYQQRIASSKAGKLAAQDHLPVALRSVYVPPAAPAPVATELKPGFYQVK